MKAFFFIIAFLSSFCCFSQVYDDFSDGDFTQNPEWIGSSDKFSIDNQKQLRLNDKSGSAGYADLYTKSSMVRETNWEFYTHLLFNPSANNYGVFYLATSAPELTNSANGYVILIGGEKDCVSLCRLDNGESCVLIEGRELMKGVNSPQLNIKARCDKDGNWTLWTCLLNNESEYTQEGMVNDIRYSVSSYSGVGCVYTSSRAKSFVFDNIRISKDNISPEPDGPENPEEPDNPDPEDNLPPKIVSLVATSDTVVQIRFNESINISNAVFFIDAIHKIKQKTLLDKKQLLDLLLSGPLENNHEYNLSINGVSDISGNKMSPFNIGFKYYDTTMQTVNFADVVFNEIMVNPKGNVVFPEAEYIELYNRTDNPVSLKGWKLYYGNKPYILPEALLKPQGYVVLGYQKFAGAWNDLRIEVVNMTPFPELANSGKLVYLEDSRNKLISWLNYSDSWYKDDSKKGGGFSLECVDPDNLSGDADNWKASADNRGGTPGKENSVKSVFSDDRVAEISYFYMASPDTIVLYFTKPMDFQTVSWEENYQVKNPGNSILKATPVFPESRSVVLILSTPIQEELQIEISGLKDISGNELEGELSFKVNMPETPVEHDVVFNEIMFNPFPGMDDYVELYNNSEKYITLNQLFFSSKKEDGAQSEIIPLSEDRYLFSPKSYFCFTKSPELLNERYSSCRNRLIKIKTLPSLPDDKGNIILQSADGNVLDRLSYTEKMHSTLIDKKEGIALEKMYMDYNSQIPSSWLSASTSSSGGTPGCRNSQYRQPSDKKDKKFWLESDSFTPGNDGVNDELVISYILEGENDQANIKIFDATGHLINCIAENFRLESSGVFIWNGKDKNDRIAPIGIYIIYVEVYNPEGNFRRFKLACALTK